MESGILGANMAKETIYIKIKSVGEDGQPLDPAPVEVDLKCGLAIHEAWSFVIVAGQSISGAGWWSITHAASGSMITLAPDEAQAYAWRDRLLGLEGVVWESPFPARGQQIDRMLDEVRALNLLAMKQYVSMAKEQDGDPDNRRKAQDALTQLLREQYEALYRDMPQG